MKRFIELIVDGQGDVIFARFDHHESDKIAETRVEWEGMSPVPDAKIVKLSYNWPPKPSKK